jgi:hypothetical protein
MTATKGHITLAAATALDDRLADEHQIACNAAGAARVGVLGNNASIVTSDASTAPMRVAVAKAGFATQRSAGDGVAIWGNDGSIFVTITKPGSNSHYVTVYAKHNDAASGDANNSPIIDVVTGTAAASPVEAALPAGALKLATILVPSTATSSQSGGVVITNVYPMTAMRGGVVPLRDATDQTAWTPSNGGLAFRIDTNDLIARMAGGWVPADGSIYGIARRTATSVSSGNGSYADVSANAAWTTDLNGGMVYSNGFTVPIAGLYEVEWSVLGTGSTEGIMGIAINGATPGGNVLHAIGAVKSAGAAVGNGSALVRLNAGDTMKLWAYGNSGTIGLTATEPSGCHWAARWVGL